MKINVYGCKPKFYNERGLFYTGVFNIMITCPCNEYPLTPHFNIVKLGFTGVYIIFLFFALKHILWVLVRTASLRQF